MDSNNKFENKWNGKNILKVSGNQQPEDIELKETKEPEKLREKIEPWLTALFQSEHLSLLVGSGLSLATHLLAKDKNDTASESGVGMDSIEFSVFKEQIEEASQKTAKKLGRGSANIEDQIRVANEFIKGIEIYTNTGVRGSGKLKKELQKFKNEMISGMKAFVNKVLKNEKDIIFLKKPEEAEIPSEIAVQYLMSFLISFASRLATRERLNIFTTNYDRVIEFGAELAGIRLIDRFVGSINPIFRSSRLEVDMHYNPPGIRGEPRYLEGVTHFTKLHGSLDWIYQNKNVRRVSLPYGADDVSKYLLSDVDSLMIYPNASKDRETSEYPYVELFRDLAAAICRPNSTLVVYGYSFGDEHINRVIEDMLTIPSAHLVIISYSDEGGRIQKFHNNLKRPTQISLLIGEHFGDLKTLVDYYLPKPAIDKAIFKMADVLKARGYSNQNESEVKQ